MICADYMPCCAVMIMAMCMRSSVPMAMKMDVRRRRAAVQRPIKSVRIAVIGFVVVVLDELRVVNFRAA